MSDSDLMLVTAWHDDKKSAALYKVSFEPGGYPDEVFIVRLYGYGHWGGGPRSPKEASERRSERIRHEMFEGIDDAVKRCIEWMKPS